MPDSKITALTSISTSTDPANDPLVIVDVSDTSMAATGTTKKVTLNQLLGASGTATLASATITGDLTVRTNQLIANANGVGVGTTPSAWSGIGPALQVEQASLLSESSNQLYLTANGYFAGGQWNYINTASADQYYQIGGSHVWRSAISGTAGTAIGWSTLMTLNSTGLGVGVSPTEKLSVNGGASFSGFGINANPLNPVSTSQRQARFQNTGGDFYFGIESSSAGGFFPGSTAYATCFYNATATPFQFFTNGTLRATIDTSGNVGIGVTPSYKLHVNGRVSYSTGIGEGADLTLSSTGTQVQHGISSTWTSQNFYTGGTSRVVMKQNGQVRFVPLAADPAGAEAGDVYYNSTSNKLKCYNGTIWNDLF